MNTIEIVLIASAVINVIQFILVFLLYTNLLSLKNQAQQIYNGVGTLLNKVFAIEHITNKMSSGFTEFIKLTEDLVDRVDENQVNHFYRTSDGKYSAKTLDELLGKIKNDGSETEYFSEDEMNKLRRLFENDDTFDEDDEDS